MIIKKYRNKIFLLLLLVSIIPLFILSGIIKGSILGNALEETKNNKYTIMKTESNRIMEWFESREEILNAISYNHSYIEILKESGTKEVNLFLKDQKNASKNFLNIYYTSEEGENYNSENVETGIDGRERLWYKSAKEAKEMCWSEPYEDILTNREVITLSAPLYRNGMLKGVIGADFDFENIGKDIRSLMIGKEATTYIARKDGTIIGIFGAERTNKKLINEISNKIIDDEGMKDVDLGPKYFVVHSLVDRIDWKIISFMNLEVLSRGIVDIQKELNFVLVMTICFAGGVCLLLSRNISRPMDALREGAKKFGSGDYSTRINLNTYEEFSKVSKSFNNMADEIGSYHEQLSERQSDLEELNAELEASYEQLMATLDELNNSEEKYRGLVENMYDLVWTMDMDFTLSFANQKLFEMIGVKENELIGKSLVDVANSFKVFKADKTPLNFESLKNESVESMEVGIVNRNKEKLYLEMSTKKILKNGEPVGIQCVSRNITNRKKMESEAFERNEELSFINDISDELNFISEYEKLAKRVSESVAGKLGFEACEVILNGDEDKKTFTSYAEDTMLNQSKEDLFDIDEAEILSIEAKQKKVNDIKYNLLVSPIILKGVRKGTIKTLAYANETSKKLRVVNSVANHVASVIQSIELYKGLKDSYLNFIETLAAAVEAKDSYTEGHSYRVAKYSSLIAQKMGFDEEHIEDVMISGLLHDIGKIGISDNILTKPGKLTEEEYTTMKEHPVIAGKILKNVGFTECIMEGIKYHHVTYDLKGYPEKLKLKKLPIEAAIIGVADSFDAMTSNRAYRNGIGVEKAISELKKYRGTQFSPEVVDVFLNIHSTNKEDIENIMNSK